MQMLGWNLMFIEHTPRLLVRGAPGSRWAKWAFIQLAAEISSGHWTCVWWHRGQRSEVWRIQWKTTFSPSIVWLQATDTSQTLSCVFFVRHHENLPTTWVPVSRSEVSEWDSGPASPNIIHFAYVAAPSVCQAALSKCHGRSESNKSKWRRGWRGRRVLHFVKPHRAFSSQQ